MARKNSNWIVVVFLALLALFGVICVAHRAPPGSRASFQHDGALGGEEVAGGAGADNIELIVEEPPLHLDPTHDPQFGVGPGLWGRDRVKMND